MLEESRLLYWGDNGIHEFWENADSTFLVFRNHPEQVWSAHHHHGFLFFCSSAEDGAARLKLSLSDRQRWVKRGKDFVLEANPDAGESNEEPISDPDTP